MLQKAEVSRLICVLVSFLGCHLNKREDRWLCSLPYAFARQGMSQMVTNNNKGSKVHFQLFTVLKNASVSIYDKEFLGDCRNKVTKFTALCYQGSSACPLLLMF